MSPTGTAHVWVDISNVQGKPVDGKLARSQGVMAVCAKATQGAWFVDDLFAANHTQALANELKFMPYHFMENTPGGAQAQFFADRVVAVCGTLDVPLMVDWEQANGQFPTGAVVDEFLVQLTKLAPNAPISVYTAAWVIQAAGASTEAAKRPLIWPYYVPGAGGVATLVGRVTEGWWTGPFGGWSTFAARQFTDSAALGGFTAVDANVTFSAADFDRIFTVTKPAPTPAPTPAPNPAPTPTTTEVDMLLAKGSDGGIWLIGGTSRVHVATPATADALAARLGAAVLVDDATLNAIPVAKP